MGDEHRREAVLPPQRQQVVVEPVARDLVERRERLVHQQDLRLRHQRARDRDAHLHAAGELARIGLLEALEADQRQHLGGARLRLALADARERQRQHHVASARSPTASGSGPGTRSRDRAAARRSPHAARSASRSCRRSARPRPAMMRSSVDLPQPEGPSRLTNSPSREIEIDAADGERAVRELLGDVADRNERAACRCAPRRRRGHAHAPTPLFTNSRL